MVVQWSDKHQILVDEMGIPLSHTDCKALRAMVTAHLKKNPVDLAIICEKRMKEKYPITAKQMQFRAQDFA